MGHLSIKNWSDDDKPREKLILKGKSVLSDAELLAILIGSGSRSESAVQLSKRILASAGNLNALGKMTLQQLKTFKGIGKAKAVTILSALELGRRRNHEELPELKKIQSSKDVFRVMQPLIGELPHEEFWVIFLNNANKILYKTQLSKGGINQTVVDIRLLFRMALEHAAVAIILSHNHPSGKLEPSLADKKITQNIKSAGENLDIKLLDHLIITEKVYLSFADEGLL